MSTGFQSTLWTVITRAREGDETALEDFVHKYRAPIVSFIIFKGLKEQAEDLAQEVFLRIFADGVLQKATPEKGRFRNLICAVTRNIIGKHIRALNTQKRGSGRIKQLGDAEVPDTDAIDDGDFDREWVAFLIEAGLGRLAQEHANYHQAIERFLIQEKSHKEIAEELGKSTTDVNNYIQRGKQKLADYIQEQIRDYSRSHQEYQDELSYLSGFLAL